MNPTFLGRARPFVIAEIGGNHEGDFDYAKRLLVEAAGAGADAVKFQTYKADKIVSRLEGAERHAHFRKFELTDGQFFELAELARRHGVLFMSSLWDLEAVKTFDSIIPIHKIGSGDLTNYAILDAIARTGKPVILSTAMATLGEVRESVAFIDRANPSLVPERKIAVLHCVAMYGDARDEYANLLSIRALQEAFPDVPIGYSDHTVGTYACEIAMGMGSSVIEKHYTDDKGRAFRDHHISATKEDIGHLVATADRIATLLGRHEKAPIAGVETPERVREFRRALYLTADSGPGTVLSADNLIALRPCRGIDARRYFEILGRRLKVAKRALEAIGEDELE